MEAQKGECRLSMILKLVENSLENKSHERAILQVWNMNQYSGLVGIFHLQGSSWDRRKRSFSTHNSNPSSLATEVKNFHLAAPYQSPCSVVMECYLACSEIPHTYLSVCQVSVSSSFLLSMYT